MRRIEATLGLWLFALASASAQTEEPIPDLGSKTPDGFVVNCYWIAEFKQTEKFGGQGERGPFGQAMSPLNGRQDTTATIFITEEVDSNGELRAVMRGGHWVSKVSKLHYWSKDNQRVFGGNGGEGSGRFPTSGSDVPVAISRSNGTISLGFGINSQEKERMRVDVKTHPLEMDGFAVKVSKKEVIQRWAVSVQGFVVSDEPTTAERNTVIRQTWGDERSSHYGSWIITRACGVGKIKLVTPRGNARSAPRASGDGQNEFTFDSSSPGKLVINFKAKVTPNSALNATREHVTFTIDPIAGSAMAWDDKNPDGKASISGQHLVAKCTYTDLPSKNDDFGKKRVQLLFDGQLLAQTHIEVFFPRDATNHPGGQASSPNWFHYWLQLIPAHKVEYRSGGGPALLGRVDAMRWWSFSTVADKRKISIYDAARTKGRSYGVGEEFSGIDMFISTVKHEVKHVDQIARADPLVPSNGSDCFRNGWSWNFPTHNHWTKGSDGQWGVAGSDDDGNGINDDAKPTPPFEPGRGDDQTLDHALVGDWPNVWPLPVPNTGPHPIESDAVNYSDRNHNEDQNARNDWGDPGKNHLKNNKYND